MAASATTSPADTEASWSGVRSCSDIGAPRGIDSGNNRRYSSVDSVGSENLRARQLHTEQSRSEGFSPPRPRLWGLTRCHGERPWARPLRAAFSYSLRPAEPVGEEGC